MKEFSCTNLPGLETENKVISSSSQKTTSSPEVVVNRAMEQGKELTGKCIRQIKIEKQQKVCFHSRLDLIPGIFLLEASLPARPRNTGPLLPTTRILPTLQHSLLPPQGRLQGGQAAHTATVRAANPVVQRLLQLSILFRVYEFVVQVLQLL